MTKFYEKERKIGKNNSKKEGKIIKIGSVGIFLIVMQTANKFRNPTKFSIILKITKVKPTSIKYLSGWRYF